MNFDPSLAIEPDPVPCNCGGRLHFREGKYGCYFRCDTCGLGIACRRDGRPFPMPPSAKLRALRSAAHMAFDPLWRRIFTLPAYMDVLRSRGNKGRRVRRRTTTMARNRAYLWLACQLGISREKCHIGLFDPDTCREVIQVCEGKTAADICDWFKGHAS